MHQIMKQIIEAEFPESNKHRRLQLQGLAKFQAGPTREDSMLAYSVTILTSVKWKAENTHKEMEYPKCTWLFTDGGE